MATGEVFIVDLRKDYLGRSELCDVAEQEEGEEKEDDNQTKRYVLYTSTSLLISVRISFYLFIFVM